MKTELRLGLAAAVAFAVLTTACSPPPQLGVAGVSRGPGEREVVAHFRACQDSGPAFASGTISIATAAEDELAWIATSLAADTRVVLTIPAEWAPGPDEALVVQIRGTKDVGEGPVDGVPFDGQFSLRDLPDSRIYLEEGVRLSPEQFAKLDACNIGSIRPAFQDFVLWTMLGFFLFLVVSGVSALSAWLTDTR